MEHHKRLSELFYMRAKISVRKFEISDLDDVEEYIDLDYILKYSVIPIAAKATSMSILEGKKVIAIMSVWEILPNIAMVGLITTPRIRKYQLKFVKELKAALKIFCAYHKIRKVYMTVRNKEDQNHRWAQFLGFSKEYTMKQVYSDLDDMIGYSKDTTKYWKEV